MAFEDVKKTPREQLEELFRATQEELARRDKEERDAGLREAREIVDQFGFTPDEIFGNPGKAKRLYHNPADPRGKGWTGKGRKPQWVQDWLASGKTLEDLPTS